MTRPTAHLAILLSLSMLPTIAAGRCITDIAIFDPDRVTIPSALDPEQTARATVRAFVMRGWRVTEIDRADGHVDAELPIRQHVARVRARIRADGISFHYRESDNLPHGWEAESGVARSSSCRELVDEPPSADAPELAHPNYTVWVDRVARTLEGTLMPAGVPGMRRRMAGMAPPYIAPL